MSLTRNVSEILSDHVTFELDCIDRLYLNLYVPLLQSEGGTAYFFREHRKQPMVSTVLMAQITRAFVNSIEIFVKKHDIPLIKFEKGQRKDDLAQKHFAKFEKEEGVVFVGKAQEKAKVFRTEKRRNRDTGATYPWIVHSTAMVNHYYFYCIDRDWGPFFIKFCSYFPYNGKVCLNGHECLKRQLGRREIGYEPLDNGLLSCENPKTAQKLCDKIDEKRINALTRKWLRRLPHPFSPSDQRSGCLYDLSILQAEFSLTQVFNRPLRGRVFFEEVIRENIDLGRHDMVQLIFNRRVTRRTPGSFRTRIITEGVIPSLHVNYKNSRIKQYFKEGRALRTETTINNTRDFRIGKRLHNLPALREIGFQANRRLLNVQKISHNCSIAEDTMGEVTRPIQVENQRGSALRFDDPRSQALFSVLVMLALRPGGFANKDMRKLLAQMLGIDPANMTPGKMTYDLRRLRLHGIIERIPGTHRYYPTTKGLKIAIFFSRTYNRLLRPGIDALFDPLSTIQPTLQRAFQTLNNKIDQLCYDTHLAYA